MDEMQQLKAEVVQLKARLFDTQEEVRGYVEAINAVAKRVNFSGQSLSELVESVPVVESEATDEEA